MRKFWIILFLMGMMFPNPTLAKKKDKKKTDALKVLADKPKETGGIEDYNKAIKDAKVLKGMFNTYQKKDGKLYFEMPDSVFSHFYILSNRVSKTSNTSDYVAGQMVTNPMLLRFTKDSTRVYMHLVQNDNVVSKDDPIAVAFQSNFADPVLKAFKIAGRKDKNVLIEVTSFFGGNEKCISPIKKDNPLTILLGGKKSLKGTFDSDASGITEVKAFPKNVEIKSVLSYNLTEKDMPYTVEMHRSLFVAPDKPMRMRLKDKRVGFFETEKNIYSSNKDNIDTKTYINRWRLEPKDGEWEKYYSGELVEPKKQIVYYVDTAFPEKWRATVRQGIEDWNKAFEAAGFKNVVKALDYPKDDPNFDPDDMRYNCVKYAVTDIANAMGPSYVDPRTGEILTADVIWYHNVVSLLHDWRFVQTAAVDARTHKAVFDDDLMQESMRYVAAHEVGHTLGLMHNMGASYAFPVDSLRSPSFTQKYGTTPSIMDYARNNFVAQPGDLERGVRLTPPILGVADIYAINWGYRLIKDADTPEAEKKTLDAWIDAKKGNPMFEFGAQQFMGTVDPTAQSEDLGNDHIKAGNYAISNLKIIVKNLEKWTFEKGKSYDDVTAMYKEVVSQYSRHLHHVIPYLGGVCFHEIRQGDNQKGAKTYMDKVTQRKAMKWLVNQALTYNSWLSPQSLLVKLDLPSTVNMKLQKSLAGGIFGATTLFRVSEGYKVNPTKNYSLGQYMNDAFNEIFQNTLKGKALSESDINLQASIISLFKKSAGLDGDDSKKKGLSLLQEELKDDNICLPSLPCSHTEAEYSFMRINYGLPALSPNLLEPLMLSQLKKVVALYKQKRTTGDAKTRNYYEYQILQMDKLLKK